VLANKTSQKAIAPRDDLRASPTKFKQ